MIQATSCGIRRGDLTHAERNHEGEETAHQRANEGASTACGIEGGVER